MEQPQQQTQHQQQPQQEQPATATLPTRLSRSSTASSKHSLTLDLSSIPPLSQPTPPSNTLLFTNLQSTDIFLPDNLSKIRDLVAQIAPIHAWAPLKSFRRIVVSFFDEDAAIRVRSVWDGEAILGERCRVYFGAPTPVDPADTHLALPDAGKLFFISPPPSPPHGWEMRLEDAPNKMVHAEDLADALARLRHQDPPVAGQQQFGGQSPISPADSNAPGGGFSSRQRSRSSTLIFQPEPQQGGNKQDGAVMMNLPCVTVDDMTDEPEEDAAAEEGRSPMDVDSVVPATRPIMAHTARPPVELMHGA